MITLIKTPDKMYFCKILNNDNSICWGFLSPSDERLATALEKIEVSIPRQQELLSGGYIVYYNGEVFNADSKQYYLDENFDFQKISDEQYNQKIANETKKALIQKLYELKAEKAYGGIIINDLYIFETNETARTNVVATLGSMADGDVSHWKFWTKDGVPVMQIVTKAQLFGISSFGRQMIDDCFKVEGQYLATLENATIEQLISKEWVEIFEENAQTAFNNINNHLVVSFQ